MEIIIVSKLKYHCATRCKCLNFQINQWLLGLAQEGLSQHWIIKIKKIADLINWYEIALELFLGACYGTCAYPKSVNAHWIWYRPTPIEIDVLTLRVFASDFARRLFSVSRICRFLCPLTLRNMKQYLHSITRNSENCLS